jgi:ubiquinone/menaquinone biosynthesis C-methylase UbiE
VAAAYATSAVHASGPDLRALVEAAALTGRERVLDIGCGAGHTALAVAQAAAHVTAVDLTPEMLEVAAGLAAERAIANVEFRLADVAALPFADDSFDLVTSRFSAHHYAAPTRAVAEAARVLRPGGRFLLVDTMAPEDPALDTFYNAAELLRDISHVRNWRISEWRGMLSDAGFASETLMEMMLDLNGDAWVTRMQTPPPQVAAIHALFAAAPPAAIDRFRLRLGAGWGWSIPVALLRGTLDRH